MNYTLFNENLIKAEKAERLARALQDQNVDASNLSTQHKMKALFDKSWQGYSEVEGMARDV